MANAASSASAPGSGPSTSSLPPPAALPEELVEEILLRIPPDEPASLLRAALVCKPWRRLVYGPGFRRRFREFVPPHPADAGDVLHDLQPPIPPLGAHDGLPPASSRARPQPRAGRPPRPCPPPGRRQFHFFVVWDPITDEERKVHFPRVPPQYNASSTWAAALLCSAAAVGAGGCDHLDCHRRPFTVVSVRTAYGAPGVVVAVICTYSSDVAAWSEPTCSPQPYQFNPWLRSVLVGNTLYFGALNLRKALKYNVQLRQMSSIQLPSPMPLCRSTLLTAAKDGGLLFATEHESKLYVWSRKDANDVDASWEQSRVIELKMLLPADADFTSLDVVGSTDDLGIIFLRADDVLYATDLKTYKGKKVYEGAVKAIVPFMSFYTPELEAAYAGEGPSDEIGSGA